MVDRTADLVPTLQQRLNTDIGYHQGVIVAWNRQTGDNTIEVAGANLQDVPMLNITEALVLKPGNVVALLRFKTAYFILGRVVMPNTSDFFSGVMPDLGYSLWQTNSDTALQNNTLAPGSYYPKLAGAFIINHPFVSFEGKLNLLSGATGNWRIAWYYEHPGNGANPPGATVMYESDISSVETVERGTYQWPTGLLGTLVYVSFEVQMTGGTTGVHWVAVIPHYLYGHGSVIGD